MPTQRSCLVAGEWRRTSETLSIHDPFSQGVVAEVCQAGKGEIEEAIVQAGQAFSAMRRLPAYQRAESLFRVAQALRQRAEELAHTIRAEAGKPIVDARREVARAIQTFAVGAEEAKRITGEVIPLDLTPGTEWYVGLERRVPIGPGLGITPFNFPLNLVAHKVAPALASGNPSILKPAPQTPLTALLLGEVLIDSGLPRGAISILPCSNALAEQMVMDDRLTIVRFTGSVPVGWMLKAKAGKKRVVLELGGNASVIVEPDADLKLAAQRCVAGGYTYAGQSCISVQRVHIHGDVAKPFMELLLAGVRGLRTGDPADEKTNVGPVIDESAARRIQEWIEEAVAGGATVLTGGKRQGALVQPTVLANVEAGMKVSCREVFGPLITVTRYQRFEDALQAVNASAYGLQAGLFTRDVHKIFQAYQELELGGLITNEIPTFRTEHMPYGGVKDSGFGREGVRYAIEEMTDRKLLVLNLPPRPPAERPA